MTLAPQFYQATRWLNPVGQGVAGAHYVQLSGVAKFGTSEQPYCVANEWVAWRLGTAAGLPIPPGALLDAPAGSGATCAWVSLNFNPGGEQLPPIDPVTFVRALPTEAALIVAFDVLIANEDRHARNLSFLAQGRHLQVFDHSHAVLGAYAGRAVNRMDSLRGELGLGDNHCLRCALTSAQDLLGQAEWLMSTITLNLLRTICRDVGNGRLGVSGQEQMALTDFLMHRHQHLADIIRDGRSGFTGIASSEWGML